MAHLCSGPQLAPIPYQGRDHVSADMQIRCEVDCLVTPMQQVTSCRADRDRRAVYEQSIPVVGGDADKEVTRFIGEFDCLAEVKYPRLLGWSVGECDPIRCPGRVRRPRSDWRQWASYQD